MNHRVAAAYVGRAGVTAVLLLFTTTPVDAQEGFLDRVTRAAKGISSTSAELAMRGATSIDLESQALPAVSMDPLTFGVSKVEVKDKVGVRVHAYFYNSTDQAVSIPLPEPGMFVLVDEKGRRLEAVSEPRIDKLAKGATEIMVPALERVSMRILYGAPAADAEQAVLKVGTHGSIRGIPVRAAPTAAVVESTPVIPPEGNR